MKRMVWNWNLFLVFFLGLASCAHMVDPAGPLNQLEAMPVRNQDPRWGIVINEGTTNLNFFIKDQAGRLVEQGYMAGANRFLEADGQSFPNYWIRQLEFGSYQVEIFPFYYQTDLINPLFGKSIRYRVDLPKQVATIEVGRNPTAYYDYGYGQIGGTYRHWGWILRLSGGSIPPTAHGLPGFKFGIR